MMRRLQAWALAALTALAMTSATAASVDDWLRTTGTQQAHARLQALAQDHAGWRMLGLLWPQPELVAPAARALGLATVQDAEALANRLRDAMGMPAAEQFTRLVGAPPLPVSALAAMPRLPWADVQAAIKRQTVSDGVGWYRTDATLHLPTRAQLELLANAQPFQRLQWRDTVQDCDDFVQAFRGWLAQHGLGNLAIGYASFRYYTGSTALGSHAVAIAMDADHKVWLIDPQVPGLHEPIGHRLGGFVLATRAQLSFVMH